VGSPRIMVVDADRSDGSELCVMLHSAGHEVIRGARDQQSLAGLPARGHGLDLTVPVGDATDASVVLTTIEDTVGTLNALVIPVEPVEGSITARVRAVSHSMALAEGLCAAAQAVDLPVFIVGSQAPAVLEFVTGTLEARPERIAVVDAAELLRAMQEPSARPRRSRWAARARRIVRRVLPERAS